MVVSKTPFSEAVSEDVYENLPAKLQESGIHGFDTAAADESMLLWGPPGAGKTTESVGRLAAYAKDKELSPFDVTVVTYRSKLAEKITQEVKGWGALTISEAEQKSDDDPYQYFGTAHAVAARASDFFDRIGTKDDEKDRDEHAGMVDYDAERAFCELHGITHKNGVKGRDSEWEVFHGLYTFCKQNLLDVGEWKHLGDGDFLGTVRSHETAAQKLQEFNNRFSANTEFENAVAAWERWKAEHNCHDFYEQLEAALVTGLPASEYVIIDELHDAYPLMVTVFQRWIDAADTVIAAGDPNQVCNGFSGAHPSIFNGLNDRVETDLKMVRLPESHRVPDEHYAAASRILSRHHEPPALRTAGQGGIASYRPDDTISYDNSAETWTPMHPKRSSAPRNLIDKYGTDMMFMGRTQMIVDGIGAGLDAGGYVYHSQNGVAGNWERRLNVMKALSLVENVRPGKQGDIVSTDYSGTPDNDIIPLMDIGMTRSLTPEQAAVLIQHTHQKFLREDRSDILTEIAKTDMNDDLVKVLKLDKWVTHKWWTVYGRGYDSIENLVLLTKKSGFSGHRERDVIAMQRAWKRYAGEGRYNALPSLDDIDTKLWTIHAAKGDEAKHAVVYTGVTGRVRDGVRADDGQAANEARTWYVAFTRASETLHVVHDAFEVTAGDFKYIPDDLVSKAINAGRERRRNMERMGADD